GFAADAEFDFGFFLHGRGIQALIADNGSAAFNDVAAKAEQCTGHE
ncbi:MAG: hypothetical protein JWQ69_1150, partial [Pseudomonas sp.]|nr:hypothetical protein [Pseudomonas sp.]